MTRKTGSNELVLAHREKRPLECVKAKRKVTVRALVLSNCLRCRRKRMRHGRIEKKAFVLI